MTSHNTGPHHNILIVGSRRLAEADRAFDATHRRNERGYTLVALLALMTVLALFALAAAPSIRQQGQREREAEAIFRGEQVANAIRLYYRYQVARSRAGDTALPTSVDQLLEGLPMGTRKVQILRASAARDPLSDDGEWRLVRPRSQQMSDFVQSLMLYSNNIRPNTFDPQLKQVELVMAPPVIATLGLDGSGSGSIGDDDFSGPFIGVSSRSRNNSVIYYYGIGKHNEWVFTPLFR
jgi:type II secretory pathway pseudopilin PulG